MADWVGPVRLAYGTAQDFHPSSGVHVFYTYVVARVDNIGYAKQVSLHFRQGSGQWGEHPLSWIEWRGDHDIFSTVPPHAPLTTEFALSYTVNGQTYWDSQFGRNYRLDALKTVVGGHIALVRATTRLIGQFSDRDVTGEIHVNNLSPSKVVGVRLSTDGGTTWQDVAASYAGPATEAAYVNLGVVELWRFQTPVFAGLHPIRLAAYFRDLQSGNAFWDNNFGHNYVLSPQPGSDIR